VLRSDVAKSYLWILRVAMQQSNITVDKIREILKVELAKCDPEQIAIFRLYSVEPYLAPILRYGKPEKVVVVARKSDEAIYWEEVEEGFNLSPVGHDGSILEHWCNQDDLGTALNQWIDGRKSRDGNCLPAKPLIP